MNENITETESRRSFRDKIIEFYKSNKTLIYTTLSILLIIILATNFYFQFKENKRMRLSDNFIEAKIYIQNNEKNRAEVILKEIIMANDKTYSTLSLFLILKENLVVKKEELLNLFNHVLENNKFNEEAKNLIILKKAIFQSDFISEPELLETIKPVINSDSLWKPHGLMLLGDYFFYKQEFIKSKEFYLKILSLKNLQTDLYDQAKSQLTLIENN